MISRYSDIKTKQGANGKQVLTSLTLPIIEERDDDVYIITNSSDRLDALAFKYYGDARYWWVIAVVNNLGKGTFALDGGIQIRIPQNPSAVIDAVRDKNNI